jgi:[acyl-carrier-protein] S-malonyltransferase
MNRQFGVIFPGQGSQSVGMGRFLFDNFPYIQHLFEEASDTLGVKFRKLCFDGPESDLNLTENTQPALLLCSYAPYLVLKREYDVSPVVASGHSVGEYAALTAAEVLSFSDALRAVKLRGASMQEAVPVGVGGMAAVMGLEASDVSVLCEWVSKNSGKILEVANFNTPQQTVISGHKEALDWLQLNMKDSPLDPSKRIKLIPLKVSAPFHCSLMMPAQLAIADFFKDKKLSEARFPIVQNVTGKSVTDPVEMKKNLIEQICGAVRWTECVLTLKGFMTEGLIECGPGKVLSGLVKKIDESLVVWNINSLEEIKALESTLK